MVEKFDGGDGMGRVEGDVWIGWMDCWLEKEERRESLFFLRLHPERTKSLNLITEHTRSDRNAERVNSRVEKRENKQAGGRACVVVCSPVTEERCRVLGLLEHDRHCGQQGADRLPSSCLVQVGD